MQRSSVQEYPPPNTEKHTSNPTKDNTFRTICPFEIVADHVLKTCLSVVLLYQCRGWCVLEFGICLDTPFCFGGFEVRQVGGLQLLGGSLVSLLL